MRKPKKANFHSVSGEGNKPSRYMMVGEAPGDEECYQGRPFVGPTGIEVSKLMASVGMHREDVYLTNWCKTRLDEGKDVSDEDAEMMEMILSEEIDEVRPEVIMALGSKSMRYFVKNEKIDLEARNGVPFEWEAPYGKVMVVPSLHPAISFHSGDKHQWVMEAFSNWKKVINGKYEFPAGWGNETFRIMGVRDCLREMDGYLAIDTETYIDGSLYMVQISTQPDNCAFFYVTDDKFLKHMDAVNDATNAPGIITIMQNAMFDWRLIRKHGLDPARVHDTMQIAFLLQTLPLGLKGLSYRLLGWKMKTYNEVVYGKEERGKKDEDKDLSMIDGDRREEYASKDPVATLRDYLAMKDMWYDGMGPVFDRDMRSMHLFMAMMDRGMLLDTVKIAELQRIKEFENADLQDEMMGRYPETLEVAPTKGKQKGIFNPGSDKQLSELLYDKLRVHRKIYGFKPRMTKWGGSVDDSHLLRLQDRHPIVPMVQTYRYNKTLIEDYLEALPRSVQEDGAIHTKFSLIRNKHSGRPASSDPNLLNIPVRTEYGRMIRDAFVARDGFEFIAFDYCLAPGTRIMTHDLRWVSIENIKEGDEVWGVDENPTDSPFRKMRKTKIQKVDTVKAESYRITMEDGSTIVASDEHPWLAKHPGEKHNGSFKWIKTNKLRPGYQLWKAAEVWEQEDNKELGYLGGAFDGEGSISVGRGIILTFTQKMGVMMEYVRGLLKKHGYEFHDPWLGKKGGFENSGTAAAIWISNRRDIARFLGTCRPVRLLDKAQALFEGRRPPMKSVRIMSVESVGKQDLISIQTDTHTFIAEGFITHNSQIEMRLMAHLANDETMIEYYIKGLDIHTQTAMRGFGIERVEDVDEMLHRYPAKRTGFGIINDISDKGLARELTDGGAKGWTPDKCHEFKKVWFGIYPGVKAYMEECKREAKLRGKVTDLWGRMEYIPHVRAEDRGIREKGERIAINQSIQSGAAGIIKEAMVKMTNSALLWMKHDIAYPLLQIYDDLTFEVRTEKVEEVGAVIKHHMENACKLRVPLVADGKRGKKWGSMNKWGK